jgi:plastocyanin
VRRFVRWMIFVCSLLMEFSMHPLHAQGVEVSGKILIRSASLSTVKKHQAPPSPAKVVVWLSPLRPGAIALATPAHQTVYRLVQKDKMFTPHLLVVPTGSQVEFPNEDPFFHNVFSLFNGKRFDLGLYESGTSRSVRFDREGVSYIFCNIHPEMGAIVLALSSPYYGISAENGTFVLHNVPPGSYRLNIWSENSQLEDPGISQKTVQISTDNVRLDDITLQATTNALRNHKNKFGEDYESGRDTKY